MYHEPAWRRYLRFHRNDPAADLDDELGDHLASLERELLAAGMTAGEAQEEARRRFGDVERIRGEVRRLDAREGDRRRRLGTLGILRDDVRYALRQLGRSPGFAAIAILSIALGVAANVAIFSVTNAVLLRPIAGASADGLVRVYRGHHSPLQYRDLVHFRERATLLSHLVGEWNQAMVMRAGADPERIAGSLVTERFFEALGVGVALGRAFVGDEDAPAGSTSEVVLSHAFWRSRFGGDSAVLGRTISINGIPVTVVGVANERFTSSVLGWSPDLWAPVAESPLLSGVQLSELGASVYATARLRRGATPAQAQTQLSLLTRQLAATDSARYARMTVRLDHARGIHAEVREPVAMLMIFLSLMVLLVLGIACANIANLLLARAAWRRTEIGVRQAIGASRWRLVRQLLTESLVLAVAGGIVGTAFAMWVVSVLGSAMPVESGVTIDLSPDRRVLVFALALFALTGMAFGLIPALRASRTDLVTALKSDASRGGFRRSRMRSGLLVGQVTLCVLLLGVASLFVRSLQNAQVIEPGFRVAGIVDVPMDLGSSIHDTDRVRATYQELLARTRAIPGVRAATLAALVPLAGTNMQTGMLPEGMTEGPDGRWPSPYFNLVAPGYFAMLEIPIVRGREFRDDDAERQPNVAIVNEMAARQWWPGQEPLGKRIRLLEDASPLEVVGVARDIKYNTLGEATPAFVYLPFAQHPRASMVVHLRIDGGVTTIRQPLWDAVREVNPALPPPTLRPMTEDVRLALFPAQFGATLLGAFGLVALVLAVAGVYGITSYTVAQRTRELGIRSALGATRARVLRLVVGETMRLVGLGSALGIALAIGVGRLVSGLLYEVRPGDPLTLLAAPLLLGTAALVASLIPARRAASVSPVAAMRGD